MRALKDRFASDCLNAEMALQALIDFCITTPRLPDLDAKTFRTDQAPLDIDPEMMTREEIVEQLDGLRGSNDMAAMAFYAWRDLSRIEPEPFVRAAVRRNPVCLAATRDMTDDDVVAALGALPDASIYDGPHRLAQPDEVWNFGRGDGLEKALLLAAVLRARRPDDDMSLELEGDKAVLHAGGKRHPFTTAKTLAAARWAIS